MKEFRWLALGTAALALLLVVKYRLHSETLQPVSKLATTAAENPSRNESPRRPGFVNSGEAGAPFASGRVGWIESEAADEKEPLVAISGRVFNDRGALPFFELLFSRVERSLLVSVRADASGHYEVVLPTPGRYQVHGRSAPALGLLASLLLDGPGSRRELDVQVPAVGRLAVKIMGGQGENVILTLAHSRLSRVPVVWKWLAEDRAWEADLTESEYCVRAFTESGLFAEDSVQVEAGGRAEVELSLAAGRGLLFGRVVDSDTGAGLAGVRLTGLPESSRTSAWSGPDGNFAMAPSSRLTPASIRAQLPGYLDQQISVARAAAQAPQRVRIEMSKGFELAGAVVDEDDRPVVGARVALKAKGRSTRYAFTRERGLFEVSGLSAGSVQVWASTPEKSSSVKVLQIPHSTVGLKLNEPALLVQGQVSRAGGEPIAEPFEVQVLLEEPPPGAEARPPSPGKDRKWLLGGFARSLNRTHDYPGVFRDPEGRFELFGLPPGKYRLAILGKSLQGESEGLFYGKSEPFELRASGPPVFVRVQVD